MKGFVRDPNAVVRSDFFPGLGWMMRSDLWFDIGSDGRWPRGYWDDWIREPERRKGRETIRPEISRTFHFGQTGGTSGGQYSSYLDSIQLNTLDIDWNTKEIDFLRKSNYDSAFRQDVEAAPLATLDDLTAARNGRDNAQLTSLKITYNNLRQFERISQQLKVMDNIKAGVPRTAYKGVVAFPMDVTVGSQTFVYIVPRKINWEGDGDERGLN